MARVVIASSADADYADIITYLAAQAGWRTAAKYDELFERLYDRLAGHPHTGAPRPALGRNIRIGIVTPYIVVYRNDDDSDTVTVLRVVHGRRRITGRMLIPRLKEDDSPRTAVGQKGVDAGPSPGMTASGNRFRSMRIGISSG